MEELYLSEKDEIFFDENLKTIENNEIFPYLLFHTLTYEYIMYRFEEDLSNINDYIYYNNLNLEKKLEEKRKFVEYAKTSDFYREYKYEGIMAAEDEELRWKSIIEEVNKTNNIVLLLSFLEGALKEISKYFENEVPNFQYFRKKDNISNINYYISKISKCCNYKLHSKLEKQLEIINKAKLIRNAYVHEWTTPYYGKGDNTITLKEELNNFKITNLIDSISKILYMCEHAGIIKNILKQPENPFSKYLIAERTIRLSTQFSYQKEDKDLIETILSN